MFPPPTTTAISVPSSNVYLGDLLGDPLDHGAIDRLVGGVAGERFTGELEHYPLPRGRSIHEAISLVRPRARLVLYQRAAAKCILTACNYTSIGGRG